MRGTVDLGHATQPCGGETVCGDVALVHQGPAGRWLVCLADGLGHGPEAAHAAEAACRCALDHADAGLEAMLRGIDSALVGSRGAAVSVLRLDAAVGTLEFAGIGNVELRTLGGAAPSAVTSPGILGRGVRRVRVAAFALTGGELLVLHTDGISSRCDLDPYRSLRAQPAAAAIVAAHRRTHDDAACVVLRFDAVKGVA